MVFHTDQNGKKISDLESLAKLNPGLLLHLGGNVFTTVNIAGADGVDVLNGNSVDTIVITGAELETAISEVEGGGGGAAMTAGTQSLSDTDIVDLDGASDVLIISDNGEVVLPTPTVGQLGKLFRFRIPVDGSVTSATVDGDTNSITILGQDGIDYGGSFKLRYLDSTDSPVGESAVTSVLGYFSAVDTFHLVAGSTSYLDLRVNGGTKGVILGVETPDAGQDDHMVPNTEWVNARIAAAVPAIIDYTTFGRGIAEEGQNAVDDNQTTQTLTAGHVELDGNDFSIVPLTGNTHNRMRVFTNGNATPSVITFVGIGDIVDGTGTIANVTLNQYETLLGYFQTNNRFRILSIWAP